MKLRQFVGMLVAVVLLSPALFAAEDLTGKWSGSFVITTTGGEPRNDIVYMVLKHAGTELSGSAGRTAEQQWPIMKGTVAVTKIEGKESTRVSFYVFPAGSEGPGMHFDLELIDSHLKGKANLEQDMAAVLDLTRVK